MRPTTVGRAMLVMALLGAGAATPVTAQSLPDLQRRALAVDPAVADAQARAAFEPTVEITANQTEAQFEQAQTALAQVRAVEFEPDLRVVPPRPRRPEAP